MIDLADTRSWPREVLDLLERSAEEISREKDFELRSYIDGNHRRMSPACPKFKQTKATIELLISAFEIRAFHCTRLIDPEAVRRKGLKVLTPSIHRRRVLTALKLANVPDSLLAAAEQGFNDCESNGGYAHRKGSLWFTLNRQTIDESGCDDLFKWYGGEVTRHALHALADKVFPVLASIGVPCVVEAKLFLRDAMPHHLSALAEEFIRLSWQSFLNQTVSTRDCDMMITHSIPPIRILDVREKELPIFSESQTRP